MRLSSLQVIYDGHCGFCVRSVRILRALDVWDRLRFHDASQRDHIEALFPALRDMDLDTAMCTVDAEGGIHRGFYAFRRLIWCGPLTWPLLPLFYCPGAGILGPRIYAWVARNRSRFGCRSDACPLPPEPPEPRGGRG